MKILNWPLIAIVGASGFVFAAATITAWIQGYEHWVGLIFIAGAGKMAAFFAPKAPMRNAFIAGFFMGLTAVWTQAAFLDLYFKNNPAYLAVEIPFGLDARSWTIIFAPAGAILVGILSSLVSWPIAKLTKALRKS